MEKMHFRMDSLRQEEFVHRSMIYPKKNNSLDIRTDEKQVLTVEDAAALACAAAAIK